MPLTHLLQKPPHKRLFALLEEGQRLQLLQHTQLYPVHLLAFAANERYPQKEKHLWGLALKTELILDKLQQQGEAIFLNGPIEHQWIEKRERLGEWEQGFHLPFEFLEYLDLADAP